MQDTKFFCRTCGHPSTDHKNSKCNHVLAIFGRQCPCEHYTEISISDNKRLYEEFKEALHAYRQFSESCKGSDGIYRVTDFKQAVLIHERQDYLWRELNKH
ncbi:MAG: hypothetical protein KGI28_06435 [Thaumarchaeota archaeon]|nr:hypothetical protein [Nitrososphaerota archaeon]